MKPVEVSLEQVLLARENRAGRQQRLLAQYGLPLVSFTMNMAGPVKDTPLSRFAFQAGVAALTKRLGDGFMLPDGSRDRLRGPAGI